MFNVVKVVFAMTINVGIRGHPLAHPRGCYRAAAPPPKSKRN